MADRAEFAETHCRLCGTRDCPVRMTRPEFRIRRCPSCGTLWCDPLRFGAQFNPDDEAAYLAVDDSVRRENTDRLRFLRSFGPPSTHPRLVEIGCMHGDFVEQAGDAGYRASGLDLSRTAVAHAERHRPGMVRYGTLSHAQEDASLDVVAAFNVVEHMEDPGTFLDHVYRVLRPGGIFVAETPARESIYHAVLFARGWAMRAHEGLEVGMHPGTHIFKFGRRAWRNVLERRGFALESIEPKSTPLPELLAKTRDRPAAFRAGIVGFGLLARATGLGNRVLVGARRVA